MKEFEQALNRARSMVSGDNEPVSHQAEPRPTPTIDGTPSLSAALAKGMDAPAAPRDYPVLEAQYEKFRENFGSTGPNARSVDGAFRILRTQVLAAMRDRGARILGVTSPSPGAGKTVTSIHLAMACARRPEQHLTLADFDFRRPAVANYLDAAGFKSSVGFFRGEGNVGEYMTRTEAGNLNFLLTDRSSEMSAEFLAGDRMSQALDYMTRKPNSIVIADLPPMTGCDDTIAMLPKLDGIVVVVAAGEHSFSEVSRTIEQLPQEKIVATVLNKSETHSPYYEYYY
ncbi:CpsD/CapB family tyrosine-protein kinase [Parvularcula sp. LCG005]|uniref:CpsD/CapB family tyrosine-protein kinase n=1 Tax=Parvularcula sp. LCG005 TaxID=3078805 RepID=UPI00294264B3|nr:CpsD/CapB family tyrosine-protein kinase [Parvularcula sp. LCG005]WOI53270.1 CpsD/CapB family tyrosine-protein kinase [Parvularcula sp. LCG005]